MSEHLEAALDPACAQHYVYFMPELTIKRIFKWVSLQLIPTATEEGIIQLGLRGASLALAHLVRIY